MPTLNLNLDDVLAEILIADDDLETRVDRGVAVLFELRPDWPWALRADGNLLVDTALLDLTRADLCPGGQVLGNFWNLPMLAHLATICADDAVAPDGVEPDEFDLQRIAARLRADAITIPLGFAAYPEDAEPLRLAWVRRIAELRAAGQPTQMAGAA